MENAIIGHCYKGKHDKVYILSWERSNSGGWDVIASYGKRPTEPFRKPQGVQIKTKTGGLNSAIAEANRLFEIKRKRGYQDIRDADYQGPLRPDDDCIAGWVADSSRNSDTQQDQSQTVVETNQSPYFTVRCIMDVGLEEHFEEGKDYKATRNTDPEMLDVVDMNGEPITVFSERFEER